MFFCGQGFTGDESESGRNIYYPAGKSNRHGIPHPVQFIHGILQLNDFRNVFLFDFCKISKCGCFLREKSWKISILMLYCPLMEATNNVNDRKVIYGNDTGSGCFVPQSDRHTSFIGKTMFFAVNKNNRFIC